MIESIGYVAAIFMGLVLGVTGGGGSILTVPILVYLFKIPAVTATGYSLFVVGVTAVIGGASNALKGNVAFKAGLAFALPSFIGVYLTRAYLLPSLPEVWLKAGGFEITKSLVVMLAFAVLMLLASITMIRGRGQVEPHSSPNFWKLLFTSLQGLLVGAVTGFVGAGGGFLIVPALAILVVLPMVQAVGTSLVIVALNSLIGFAGDLSHANETDWTLLLTLSALSIAGILVGLKIAKHLPGPTLKKIFGWFVLVMGSIILIEQLSQM